MRNKVALSDVIIELHVPDFDIVKDFYGKLGFEVVWERNPESKKGYLVLKMDNNILCFWAGNAEVWNHDYFRQYPNMVKKLAKVVEKLGMRPWGLRDFRIEDPFGYYLRITEHHNILDSKYAVP